MPELTEEELASRRAKSLAYSRRYAELHRERINENVRRWRAANPEKVRASTARQRETNAAGIKTSKAKWYRSHRARAMEIARAWKDANVDRRSEVARAWRINNRPTIATLSAARRARVRGLNGRHTTAEWDALLASYHGRCVYCWDPAEHRDHAVPLARGGDNDIENIVPACAWCNRSKHDKPFLVWIASDVSRSGTAW